MDNSEFKIVDNLSKYSGDSKAKFTSGLDSTSNVRSNYHKVEFDLEWLDMMESTLRYIENILLNPKKFIINEEELVLVEKSKKVTVESVIHLSQHTSLISDFDEDSGEVKPTKILNILKEETLDTYENRFIYTLINNMLSFINIYGMEAMQGSSVNSEKNLKYTGSTNINGENVTFEMNMVSTQHTNLDKKVNGMTSSERIKKVKERVEDFTSSELYKDLARLHVPPVRSPIRKTNVILKNPNFQRAEALWNFLEKYDKEVKKEVKYNRNYSENVELKQDLDNSFLMNYVILDSLSKTKDVDTDWAEVNLNLLKRTIKAFLDFDPHITEASFISLCKKQFKAVKKEQQVRDVVVKNIIENDLNRFNKNKNQALLCLR